MSDPFNRSWPDSVPLRTVLEAGEVISGTNASEHNKAATPSGLPDVLRARLEQFDSIIDGTTRTRSLDLQALQLDTSFAALYVLERVHALLLEHEAQHVNDSSAPPLIGTRDMAQIRTHLSVFLNWGVELLFTRILPTLPDKPSSRPSRVPPGAQIIDLTAAHEDYVLLFDVTRRLLNIILPSGPEGLPSTTFVAMTVLSRGFTGMLWTCIFLAWLPRDIRGDLPCEADIKPYVARLLNGSQPAQTITALGTIMRKTQKPLYVRKVCRILSTEQLLRPKGIAGLFSSVFGEDPSSSDAPLEKLQSTSNVLNTVPPNVPPEDYYPMIIPRILHLLGPDLDKVTPPSHKRAAAFSLSRMLAASTEPEGTSSPDLRRSVIDWCLLDGFKPARRSQPPVDGIVEARPSGSFSTPEGEGSLAKACLVAQSTLVLPPSQAIPTLSTILMNTDPSPELIDTLLQPVAPQLYSLLEYLRTSKTADLILRETVEGLLGIWARAAEKGGIIDGLWAVIDGKGGQWDVDEEDGELRVFERSRSLPSLTLAQLADLQEGKHDWGERENEEENPLGLHPHPGHFAQFLKSIKREDVASATYLRILDAHVKLDSEEDPIRKLLLFELSMQIATHVGADAGNDSPLRRPDVTRMLMFIKMSLDQDPAVQETNSGNNGGKLSRGSLRFVYDEDDEDEGEGDSDDEDLAPGLEGVSRHEHLSMTAVNLLLALLEEHPDLSPKTVPLLSEIFSQLETLANSASDALRPRAREARIALTARLASSSAAAMGQSEATTEEGEESTQERYQRALKLLQDPILPVRAHGLLLLRELVAPAKRTAKAKQRGDKGDVGHGATVSTVQGAAVGPPSVDAALIPAILSIFMQSIQDEDSYIFLNAVQGLAAMVDGFGSEVLKTLVDAYSKGLEGVGGFAATMTVREVDFRVRVGEALSQVIRRCGGALGKYVNVIVPRLFAVVREPHLATTLRTSAVSLLATAADTNALALTAYAADLISSMVDLVQVESVPVPVPVPVVRATKDTAPPTSQTPQTPAAHSPDVTEVTSSSDSVQRNSYSRNKASPGPGTAKYVNEASLLAAERKECVGGNGSHAHDAGGSMVGCPTTAADSKFPPLRRAALHFLSLLLRALLKRGYEGDGTNSVPPGAELRRADSVLGYVSITDEDGVVRVMAREAIELLQQLRNANALLGL